MQGIYRILNTKNGKYYIGSSQNIGQRLKRHLRALKDGSHINPHLQSAWNKYREESFVFEFVEEIPGGKDARLVYEQHYLNEGFEQEILYNIAHDATASMCGRHHTKETKARISKAKSNPSEETRAKMSRAQTGKKLSEETKAKMSKAQMGRKATEETKAKIGKARKGFRHTKESRDKMSASHMGHATTQETCDKISSALMGRESPAKPFPAFCNVKTGEFIPAGHNLSKMCRARGLVYHKFWQLKSGINEQALDGWKLAQEGDSVWQIQP